MLRTRLPGSHLAALEAPDLSYKLKVVSIATYNCNLTTGNVERSEIRPLDLHALDMPPAFTLSQDQTLLLEESYFHLSPRSLEEINGEG